jgi:hypothetical protein
MRLPLGFRFATVDDAGFVEMDVGFDKPGTNQPASRVINGPLGREFGFDRDDAALLDADIAKATAKGVTLGMIGNPGVANNQIHSIDPFR